MADRTTTLKTQTGDNVYPNIIGDNRNTAIADSATIKHSLADKKISFNLDNTTNNKITNSLQKPTGLTKTELVGVGTNGQENIEIGDNLTLVNGKLSASASGGGETLWADYGSDGWTFSAATEAFASGGGLTYSDVDGTYYIASLYYGIPTFFPAFCMKYNDRYTIYSFKTVSLSDDKVKAEKMSFDVQKQLYSHFITIQSGSDLNINFNYYSTTEEAYTADTLITALAGKHVACSGYVVDGGTYQMAMEVTSSNGQLQFSSFNPSDGSTTTNSFSSLDVTDSVSAVE